MRIELSRAAFRSLVANGLVAAIATLAVGARTDQRVPPDSQTTRPVAELDAAIRRLSIPGADYRAALEQTLSRPSDAQVQQAIRTFLDRTPRHGDRFECNAEFLRLGAINALWRLRAALRHESPDLIEPVICRATPVVLDRSASSFPPQIDVYGLDLDRQALQLVLVKADGYDDLTARLTVQSPYRATIAVDPAALPEAGQSLDVAWGHLIHYSIPLVRPTTRLCASRIETIPARSIDFTPFGRSDDEALSDRDADVWADVRLDFADNKVEAMLCVTSADAHHERAGIGGCAVAFLYTTDADRVIDAVMPDNTSHVGWTHVAPAATTSRRAPGVVRHWFLDRGADANGQTSFVTARLAPLRVVSTPNAGCLSPVTYTDARRVAAVSASTQRGLDRQLVAMPSDIQKVRSRFAPIQ